MKTFKKYIAEQKDKSASKIAGRRWHEQHPVDHMNIVNHYNQATKDELVGGRRWYSDAQEYASTVSRATGLPRHTIAGLTSVYSPQRDWHNNMIDASRVARRKVAVGGPTQKPYHRYGKAFAGDLQRKHADRILNGEHYDSVLKGQKTHAFASLIDHGGDVDPKNPKVVIDRHAHSVASGARITNAAFDVAGLKGKKKYDEIRRAYIQATDHINAQNGAKPGDHHYLHPHQVQAITWLVRQRLNNEGDAVKSKKAAGTPTAAGKSRNSAQQNWRNYGGTWHPGVAHLFEEVEDKIRNV